MSVMKPRQTPESLSMTGGESCGAAKTASETQSVITKIDCFTLDNLLRFRAHFPKSLRPVHSQAAEIKRVSWDEIECPECRARFDAAKTKSAQH